MSGVLVQVLALIGMLTVAVAFGRLVVWLVARMLGVTEAQLRGREASRG